MVNFCAVVSCGHKHGKDDVSFFRIPALNLRNSVRIQTLQLKRRQAWLAAIKRNADDLTEEKCEYARVCSDHFISGKKADLYDESNPDWVPCINLGYKTNTSQKSMERFNRSTKRLKTDDAYAPPQEQVETCTTEEQVETCPPEEHEECEVEPLQRDSSVQASPQTRHVEVQTELTQSMIQAMQEDLKTVNSELYTLRQDVSRLELSEDTFKENDDKVTFYTGLPNFALLLVLLNEISPFLNFTATSSLSKFKQLLLTLMKLRLNLKFVDLGYRFNVSSKTASRLFHQALFVLNLRLKNLIFWPDREELRKTMPLCFKEAFGQSVAIIIDCFEVFIERPANVMSKCQTWSSYKHHHTVKFLIGICPQGVVSFISEGWGGRVSDKHITEECGILNKLFPGDTVLADRGFDIEEQVGFHYATVRIPAFTKGKNQLDPRDVEKTRNIASVRIHVERVIGMIRQKYQILAGPIPTEMLSNNGGVSSIDMIVQICCSLNNLCKSVIPFE